MTYVEALVHGMSNVINSVRIEENDCAFFLLPWYSYISLTQHFKNLFGFYFVNLFYYILLLYTLCLYLYLFFIHFLSCKNSPGNAVCETVENSKAGGTKGRKAQFQDYLRVMQYEVFVSFCSSV